MIQWLMEKMQFRSALPSEASDICQFQLAMAMETEKIHLSPRVCMSGVQAVFSDPAKGKYFVGIFEGKIIAALLLTWEWSDWRNGNVGWIQSVYVVPQMRGKKVFSQFYAYIKEIAKSDANMRGLRLYVDKSNLHAQKVYKSLGMNGEHYQVFEWMKE